MSARRITPEAALREVQRRKLVSRNYVPHEPTAKQHEFLQSNARETLFGGAAGGGKTDGALMIAAEHIHVPGYSALVLRRNYKQLALPNAIMDRAMQWWCPNRAIKWNADDKRFTFPSGANITFGFLDCEADKFRYQGSEFQRIIFDEITQFPELWYRYLLSRLRRLVGVEIPIGAYCTGNPGGIGHDWVFRRFVRADTAVGTFIPAKLDDNPHLDVEEYVQQLDLLDEVTKKQLKEGLWIRSGSGLVYEHFNEQRNLIPRSKLPKLDYYICALDFGVVDENALVVMGWRNNDPNIYVVRAYRLKGLVEDVACDVESLDAVYHFIKVVGDIGGMGKLFQQELLSRFSLHVDAAQKSNKLGYIRIINGLLKNGRMLIVDDGVSCVDLIAEYAELPWDESRTKEHPGFNNHASDGTLYGSRACLSYLEKAVAAALSPEALAKKEADDLERYAIEDIARQEDEEREDVWG